MSTKFETDVKLVLSIQNSVGEIASALGMKDYGALIEANLEKIRLLLRSEIIDPFMKSTEAFTKELRGVDRKVPKIGADD